MAKPILIIKFNPHKFTAEAIESMKEKIQKTIGHEYYSFGFTSFEVDDISFEVLNGNQSDIPEFGDLTSSISGKDIQIKIDRDKGRQRGT